MAATNPHHKSMHAKPLVVSLPLAGTETTGFTVVAVWRPPVASGGHPFGSANAALDAGVWTETLGVDLVRTMPVAAVTAAVTVDGRNAMTACWQRAPNGGAVAWRLGNLVEDGTFGGYACLGTPTDAETPLWPSRAIQVGAVGRYLHLAELLVWRTSLSRAQRLALQSHLATKWGLPITPTGCRLSKLRFR